MTGNGRCPGKVRKEKGRIAGNSREEKDHHKGLKVNVHADYKQEGFDKAIVQAESCMIKERVMMMI